MRFVKRFGPFFIIFFVVLILFVGCTKKKSDEDIAIDTVAKLSEVQAYIKNIEKLGGPDVRPFFRAEKGVKDLGPDYCMVVVGESHPDHVVTWRRYFVDSKTGRILVEDIVTGERVLLEKWQEIMNEKGD